VDPAMGMAEKARGVPTMNGKGPVPEHLVHCNACDGCESNRECRVVAQLLSEYKDAFSCGDHDMGLTKAVCLSHTR